MAGRIDHSRAFDTLSSPVLFVPDRATNWNLKAMTDNRSHTASDWHFSLQTDPGENSQKFFSQIQHDKSMSTPAYDMMNGPINNLEIL